MLAVDLVQLFNVCIYISLYIHNDAFKQVAVNTDCVCNYMYFTCLCDGYYGAYSHDIYI